MRNGTFSSARWAAAFAASLLACGAPIDKGGGRDFQTRSAKELSDSYVILKMGSGPGYASFNTDPFGGFNGRECTGPDGIIYKPNGAALVEDEVNCLTRLILMVPGQLAQTQDLLLFYRTTFQAADNITITSDTHTATSRQTVFSIANLGLSVQLTQTVVSPSKLEQVYSFTSAIDQPLVMVHSNDTDINWYNGSGDNVVSPGPGPEHSIITRDSANDTWVKVTGSDPADTSYQGYHTTPYFRDSDFSPHFGGTHTGWDPADLNNGPSEGDAHAQLQWLVQLQAGVPFVHTATIELPPPLPVPCADLLYVPAENAHGTVVFEDLWPKNGDLDFNDQVVAYNQAFVVEHDGKVSAMQTNINVLAAGGTLRNGLFLRLPLARSVASAITLTDQDGHSLPLAPVATESELTVRLSADTRALFSDNQLFANTDVSLPVSATKAFQVKITFAAPVDLDTSLAPFDLFIARSGDYGHQVHLMTYAGSDGMDTSLFGHDDDASANGLHFLNANGLPFALHVPQVLAWPTERTSIDTAYPQITAWAATGGALNADWFSAPNPLATFNGGSSAPPPAPVMVGPALTPACAP